MVYNSGSGEISEGEYMDWARLIRDFRLMRGIKQAAFAEFMGVDQATVSRWETGRQIPELGTQMRLRDLIHRQPESQNFRALQAFVDNAANRMAMISGQDLYFIGQSPLFRQTGRAIFPKDKPFAGAARIEDDYFIINQTRSIMRDQSVFRFEYAARTFTPDGKLVYKKGTGSRLFIDGTPLLIVEESFQTLEDFRRDGGTRLLLSRFDDIPQP